MIETRDRAFARRTLAVAALGFALRTAYIFHLRDRTVTGDGTTYHALANLLAAGKGFVYVSDTGQVSNTALHPPLWPLTLALFARLGFHSFLCQQFIAVAIGVGTIIATGYAGRRVGGARVGLIAAAIVSVAPTFIFYEWELMSETLAMLGAALTLLLAYRFREKPSLFGAVSVGATCGLLALTHSEQALLVIFLLVPLILLARRAPRRTRFAWLAAGMAAAIGVAVPWAAYNAGRFRHPVLVSTELGYTLVDANCAQTYFGPKLGSIGTCRFGAAYESGHSETSRRSTSACAASHSTTSSTILDAYRSSLRRARAASSASSDRINKWVSTPVVAHRSATSKRASS